MQPNRHFEHGPYSVRHSVPSIAQSIFGRSMLDIEVRLRSGAANDITALEHVVQRSHAEGYEHLTLRIHNPDELVLEELRNRWGDPMAELVRHAYYTKHHSLPLVRRLCEVRPYAAGDLPDVFAVAENAFRFTRFYRDASFPESQNLLLYQTLIRRLLCATPSPEALIGVRRRQVVAFIAWRSWREPTAPRHYKSGQGFLAVSPGNAGCAVSLVDALLKLLTPVRDVIEFDSQPENTAAIRIWRRFGMREVRRHAVYHFVRQAQTYLPAPRRTADRFPYEARVESQVRG